MNLGWSTAWLALIVLMLVGAAWLGGTAGRVDGYTGCRDYPTTAYSPTGIVGCEVYGEGTASWYHGTGVARNDCEWPWTACTPIKITSLETGRSIIVTPTMFCDCYTGTPDERIVDLDPDSVQALGLDPDRGLFPVRVEPVAGVWHSTPSPALPDTAMR